MPDFSDPVREVVLDLLCGIDPAEDRFITLLAAPALSSMTGTTIDETALARVEILAADWSATDEGVRILEVEVVFGAVGADTELWGVALCDASTAGNLVSFQNFDEAVEIASGDAPTFPVGSIAMTAGG